MQHAAHVLRCLRSMKLTNPHLYTTAVLHATWHAFPHRPGLCFCWQYAGACQSSIASVCDGVEFADGQVADCLADYQKGVEAQAETGEPNIGPPSRISTAQLVSNLWVSGQAVPSPLACTDLDEQQATEQDWSITRGLSHQGLPYDSWWFVNTMKTHFSDRGTPGSVLKFDLESSLVVPADTDPWAICYTTMLLYSGDSTTSTEASMLEWLLTFLQATLFQEASLMSVTKRSCSSKFRGTQTSTGTHLWVRTCSFIAQLLAPTYVPLGSVGRAAGLLLSE